MYYYLVSYYFSLLSESPLVGRTDNHCNRSIYSRLYKYGSFADIDEA